MTDFRQMSRDQMLAAIEKVDAMSDEAREHWKSFVAGCPRRPNKAQAERIAFLRGRLSGLHEAKREFELRAPIEFAEQ